MKKLYELAVHKPVIVTIGLVTLLVLGTISVYKLPVEFFPEMDFPFIGIFVLLLNWPIGPATSLLSPTGRACTFTRRSSTTTWVTRYSSPDSTTASRVVSRG